VSEFFGWRVMNFAVPLCAFASLRLCVKFLLHSGLDNGAVFYSPDWIPLPFIPLPPSRFSFIVASPENTKPFRTSPSHSVVNTSTAIQGFQGRLKNLTVSFSARLLWK
jgi:hypothetical protein